MVTRPQAVRVGEELSIETTPLDPLGRAEFDTFVARVEPLVRRSLIAMHGPGDGRIAAIDALAWAWRHWDRAAEMRSPAARLARIGVIVARGRRGGGALADKRPIELSQEELTRAFSDSFGPDAASDLAGMSAQDRVALLLMQGWATPVSHVAQVLRSSRSSARRHGGRGAAGFRSAPGHAEPMDVGTVLAEGAARIDALSPPITSAEVIEHADRVGDRLLDMEDIVEETSRRHSLAGLLVVVAVIASIVWWAGGRRDDVRPQSPTMTAESMSATDATVVAPIGIAAQSELMVYPILTDVPTGYRLVDRSLTLEPSQTFGQVLSGLVRNDPDPWRRRLWLFDPDGAVVASIATFDGDSTGGSDFARTVDIGGVSVDVGQDPADRYRWWAMVHGVTAGSSTTGAVHIGGVADEAMAMRVATEIAHLDARDAEFAGSLAANMGSRWQTYREPRTVDVAAARYLRDDGGSSIFVSSFAAPAQSNFGVIFPAAEPTIAIRQLDGPMFVSIAAVPPGSLDGATVTHLADSVQLVRRDEWNTYEIETTSPTPPDPTGDLLSTGLTSADGGAVTVGVPSGRLCVRIAKSTNPIGASAATCAPLRPTQLSSTVSVVMIAMDSTEPLPERFIAGAASTPATLIRSTVVGIDGAATTGKSPLVRDPSLGPALWAVRVPPAATLRSIEYLDDAGNVLDHVGPNGD